MEENANTLIVRAYSMPAWLVVMLDDEAKRNERAASAEVRVRLAASFGLRTDGTAILAGPSPAIMAGGEAHGPDDWAAPRLDDGANGGPGDEA